MWPGCGLVNAVTDFVVLHPSLISFLLVVMIIPSRMCKLLYIIWFTFGKE